MMQTDIKTMEKHTKSLNFLFFKFKVSPPNVYSTPFMQFKTLGLCPKLYHLLKNKYPPVKLGGFSFIALKALFTSYA
jgi:hypothetical protein